MNPSQQGRRQRAASMGVEALESRQLLTGGSGSTFAIVPGTIAQKGGTASFTFTLDPTHFTMPKSGKIVIGIDVATQTGASLVPSITSVTNSQGRPVPGMAHARYTPGITRTATSFGNQTSAVLVPLSLGQGNKAASYTVTVKGEKNTSGSYLLGFYLAGDANGDGTVSQTDLQTIRQDFGATPTSSKYSFDADTNRDGVINRSDLMTAQKNLGGLTTISPGISSNLDPATDTGIQDRVTADKTVHFTGTATPGATVTYTDTSFNIPPASTTADAQGNYSVMVNLGNGSNTFNISSTDAFGQKISGTIAAVTFNVNAPTTYLSMQSTSNNSSSNSTS